MHPNSMPLQSRDFSKTDPFVGQVPDELLLSVQLVVLQNCAAARQIHALSDGQHVRCTADNLTDVNVGAGACDGPALPDAPVKNVTQFLIVYNWT